MVAFALTRINMLCARRVLQKTGIDQIIVKYAIRTVEGFDTL
jgi:hypothetical protein